MTTQHEDAVREQLAAIDRKSVLVNQLDGFYYGITYGHANDPTYVSEAEFVDACTDAGAHTYQQYGQIYTRLVAAKRGAGHIGGTL
ncbi:hypothetical protein VSH64_25040 [Amycolatopsis rhabdoformis]|uniref:Uncharacterized protein n=1 Tax=Amycolatopsis rhabdoformis TaxID=1448059 RepID=A0ABZ1HUW5_9PSEU|nr:hypothetical protein [Amycolatopsis rhabdoformis]WSE26144.1 hypothetical protein VSH64_25040 [Amycolatopsis rhabdoformis]